MLLFDIRDTRLNTYCLLLCMYAMPVDLLRDSYLPSVIEVLLQFLNQNLHRGGSRWWPDFCGSGPSWLVWTTWLWVDSCHRDLGAGLWDNCHYTLPPLGAEGCDGLREPGQAFSEMWSAGMSLFRLSLSPWEDQPVSFIVSFLDD